MAERDAGGVAPQSHLNAPKGVVAVVLAAGKGTRMRSNLPKVLHPLLGEPMICHVLRALRYAGIPPERTVVVVGYGGEQVARVVSSQGSYLLANQTEQLGTGHAVKYAEPLLQKLEREEPGAVQQVLILFGDGPLVRSSTLRQLLNYHLASRPLITMITTEAADPTGYGRIIRDKEGHFQQIIEEVELTPAQRPIKEINPSLYLYRAKWLWPALSRLKPSPKKGEYYLTDLPAYAIETKMENGLPSVQTLKADFEEVLGINDRVQLAEAETVLRRRILQEHMLAGVTITDPATTYISATTKIAPDTIIEPNTHLKENCVIGQNCVIGPNSILIEATIGDDCIVLASMVEHSTLENKVTVGPFSHVRPGSYLEEGVHLGNFAEVNRSHLGARVAQGHFSYIGDATLGHDVNVGAGTITANFDGKTKNKTIIGNNVFIGSDTVLRAPITVGDEASTGAGSVVTKDVQAGVTVVGIPARPIRRKSVESKEE